MPPTIRSCISASEEVINVSKKAHLVQTIVFLAFIAVFFVLNLVTPDKEFSQQENRYLQTAPKFSFSSLFSGKFASSFETYVTDQFTFRDNWTALKARSERIVGKDSNNGVYLCEGEQLMETFTAPDKEDIDAKIGFVNKLAGNVEAPVYLALIPSVCEIKSDLLPEGAPNDSQKDIIDYIYANVDPERITTVDMYTALSAHADERIYYRTDHHWTTLGAYYGYEALAKAFGFSPVPLSDMTETVVTNEFYGTTYSSSGYAWVQPDSISTYVPTGGEVITNYPKGAPEAGVLYDESYLALKDKYSYFYGGNTPLLTIETGSEGDKLLIVRDSYMDSLSPYLFEHFSEIHILDLRYYKVSLKAYIAQEGFDSVLVCYNMKNFCDESNLFLLGF